MNPTVKSNWPFHRTRQRHHPLRNGNFENPESTARLGISSNTIPPEHPSSRAHESSARSATVTDERRGSELKKSGSGEAGADLVVASVELLDAVVQRHLCSRRGWGGSRTILRPPARCAPSPALALRRRLLSGRAWGFASWASRCFSWA